MNKKVGIIIQARLGSTRLPNKIFLPLGSKTVLQIVIDRLKKSSIPVYIATTNNPNDREIVKFSKQNNIQSYAGDEENVLKRYFDCATKYGLDVIIRITSDCPLIDGRIIKNALENYLQAGDKNLYLSNTVERTYPRGFDFEIFSIELLTEAFLNAVESSDKEHVTPFIWKNKMHNVAIKQYKNKKGDKSKYRITLDTLEDYSLLKKLIDEYKADNLSGEEIINLMDKHPELASINEHVEQKKT